MNGEQMVSNLCFLAEKSIERDTGQRVRFKKFGISFSLFVNSCRRFF